MNHILVVTTEPLPVPGGLTTGAGLRAWGLAEGLRSRGFPVTIATPLEGDQAREQSVNPTDDRVRYFNRPELGALVEQENPDVVVMQHWGLVYTLPPLSCPLVIDLAGPHLLERLYWGNKDTEADREEKLAALRRADFIVCSGYYQRHYFYPFLAMAGFDLRTADVPVIPFSVSPEPVTGEPPAVADTTFIYGGAFLAWQNPEKPIRWLLDEMDKAGKGRLLFYGGSHPNFDASAGRFVDLYRFLQGHPRVETRGWKPFSELQHDYATQGHVALDLMERNPERELAYTTRTMVYLQCGLPVIYNNYSDISHLISDNQCGWCLDPSDEAGFRNLARSILQDPAVALSKRPAARNTALSLSWDKTIDPLADFCANPVRRTKPPSITPVDVIPEAPAPQPEDTERNLLQNSAADRNIFPRPGKWLGILVYIPIWAMSRYLYYRSRIK